MMKKILLKLLLITSPILIMLAVYFYKDPFRVLYHYDSYYNEWDSTTYFNINGDMVATQTFVQNYPKYHYDSYIFGASRSGFYFVEDWNKHITSTHSYHFNAPIESLYGVERKIQFLADRNVPIKNALVVIDSTFLERTTNATNMFSIKDPLISGESKLHFQYAFIRSYFDRKFLYAYFDFLISGKIKRYMVRDKLLYRTFIHYQNDCNEVKQTGIDNRVEKYETLYYRRRDKYFYKRPEVQHYAGSVIREPQMQLLRNMKRIFDLNHTNYKIVVSPLYDQVKLSTTDMQQLTTIFGSENVFDFSGINEITNDAHNYYENSHYRPFVCRKIMDSIYHTR